MQPVLLQPTISYRAVDKAAITLEPFVQFYFPFHGLCTEDFFKFSAILIYTEATIYQIDEEYEENIETENFTSRHMQILFEILDLKGLLDDKIREEFANGVKYYHLERRLCNTFDYAYEDIVQANKYKCYDFRVLHRLLCRLTGKSYEENLLDAIWYGEMLVDVEDDIRQYEDDVRKNVYNTYRMLVKLYGPEGKQRLEEYIEYLNGKIQEGMAQAPEEYQALLGQIWDGYRASAPVPEIPEPILTDYEKRPR